MRCQGTHCPRTEPVSPEITHNDETMNQHDFVKGALAYYEENGFYPGDGARWEVAHYPRPKGEGDDTEDLMWEHHQVQGLLQSEEEGRKCFYEYQALRFLKTTPFIEGYFELWDLYDKWSGGSATGLAVYKDPETGVTAALTRAEAEERGWISIRKGKGTFRNPVTGETAVLTPREAKEKGWAGASKGKTVFRDPETGEVACLTSEEATQRGWVGAVAGMATYEDPNTGERCTLTAEEANERGWRHIHSGKSPHRNPENGEVKSITPEEAESLGWVGQTSGKTAYRDPVTGRTAQLTAEEAKSLGWVGVAAGKAAYKNPETGESRLLTVEEAEAKGWVHVNTGRKHKHEKVTCLYCGTVGGGATMVRYHFDNCSHREGSWRWFVKEMRSASDTLKGKA